MESKLVSTHVIKLNDDHERLHSKSKLNVIDVFSSNFAVEFALAYQNDSKTKITQFLKSLEKTLIYFPEFTGSIQRTKKEMILTYDNTGVVFSVYRSNLTYEDAMKNSNKKIFYHQTKKIEGTLLNIKMTILCDQSYILTFVFHHSICDSWGFTWFLKAWSTMFKDKAFNSFGTGACSFGNYRSSAIEDRMVITGYDDRRVIKPCREYILTKTNYNFGVGEIVTEFLVSKKSLQHFKDDYIKKRNECDPMFISTTDLISAIAWKAALKARKLNEKDQTVFGSVQNFRKKFGCDESFFGNCILAFSVSLPVEEVLKLDLIEVAALVRKEIIQLDKNQIKSKLNFIESADDWNSITSNINSSGSDFFISSWEMFPFFDVEFSGGPPRTFLYECIGTGRLFIIPTENKDVLSLHINFKEEEFNIFMEDEYTKHYFKNFTSY